MRRRDFTVNVPAFVRALGHGGFIELPVTATHASRVAALPSVHPDPFDRMLVAQAVAEPMTLLTNDPVLQGYGSLIEVV